MGKSTISMVIFNSYVKLPEGIQLATLNNCSCLCCFPNRKNPSALLSVYFLVVVWILTSELSSRNPMGQLCQRRAAIPAASVAVPAAQADTATVTKKHDPKRYANDYSRHIAGHVPVLPDMFRYWFDHLHLFHVYVYIYIYISIYLSIYIFIYICVYTILICACINCVHQTL